MKKRFVSLLLAVSMFLSLCPVGAFAAASYAITIPAGYSVKVDGQEVTEAAVNKWVEITALDEDAVYLWTVLPTTPKFDPETFTSARLQMPSYPVEIQPRKYRNLHIVNGVPDTEGTWKENGYYYGNGWSYGPENDPTLILEGKGPCNLNGQESTDGKFDFTDDVITCPVLVKDDVKEVKGGTFTDTVTVEGKPSPITSGVFLGDLVIDGVKQEPNLTLPDGSKVNGEDPAPGGVTVVGSPTITVTPPSDIEHPKWDTGDLPSTPSDSGNGDIVIKIPEGGIPADSKLDLTVKEDPKYTTKYPIEITGGDAFYAEDQDGNRITEALYGTTVVLCVELADIPADKMFSSWKVVAPSSLKLETSKSGNVYFSMPAEAVEVKGVTKSIQVHPEDPDDDDSGSGGSSGSGSGTNKPGSSSSGTGGSGTGSNAKPNNGGSGSSASQSDGAEFVALAVVGGVTAGTVLTYDLVTRAYLEAVLPKGVAIPTNRERLALVMWRAAGCPEPQNTTWYDDIGDTRSQKAARWAVEVELMPDKGESTFKPDEYVSRIQVIRAWNTCQRVFNK